MRHLPAYFEFTVSVLSGISFRCSMFGINFVNKDCNWIVSFQSIKKIFALLENIEKWKQSDKITGVILQSWPKYLAQAKEMQ